MQNKVFVGIVIVFLAFLGFFLSKKDFHSSLLIGKKFINLTPTPFLLEEITVPYLRSRDYVSKIDRLEELSDNGRYKTYLTSYESDGNKINALLTVPEPSLRSGQVKFPGIVFVHGYIPPTQYVTTEKYVDYVDYLARNGFVVFKIDLRGHGQSEGKPGGGYFGSDYVVDALNAQAALKSADFVKKDAVGFWGHSMAGNIVLRAMATRPHTKAAVIWAGAVYSYIDLRKYGINDQSYRPPTLTTNISNRRREIYEKYGSPSATSKFWHEVAPTSYLLDLKGAIEIHHAEDDSVVSIAYSRDLVAELDKTKVPHEFYTYPTGGHNISGESFDLAMMRTVEFYKKYLR